jgi:hypothetical protein
MNLILWHKELKMGSYSGEDSTTVFLDVVILKFPNCTLSLFDKNKKEKFVEVWINENKIEKFYFYDFDLDLKEYVCDETSNFIRNFYEENNNLLQQVELVISYYVNGYYDPGKIYGSPENCYPEEWQEERTISSVEFILDNKNNISMFISNKHFDKIYNIFKKHIEEKDFVFDDDDYDYY